MTRGYGRAGSAECITKGSRCIGVVLVEIEMNLSGSSWKGRDSLSPQLVEYLRYSLWKFITPELFREYCTDSRQFQSLSVRYKNEFF